MTTTVAIIGAGELGGAVARDLAVRDAVSRVFLIDAVAGAAQGKALDIRQSGAICGFHTEVTGALRIDHAAGADVWVLADAFGAPPLDWATAEATTLVRDASSIAGASPLVFAGGDHEAAIRMMARDSGIPGRRLLGSAPDAFASAVRAMAALEAGCAPADVTLTVLGRPGRFVVPWSQATIAGYAVDRVLTPPALGRIEARAERVWPLGPYTLGAAAARLAEAIVNGSRQRHCVLTMLDGEFGVRGATGTLPVQVGPGGIRNVQVPALTGRERVVVESAVGTA